MAFIEGTQIFTDSGFKNVENISGRDKVLVRNFLGDAEFIQPFALKKRQYDGEIIQIGARNWSFSVTPEHIIVYDRERVPIGKNFRRVFAKDFEIHYNNRIYRQFRYNSPEDYKPEHITIHNEFGRSWVTISNQDWFVLVGYVLCRGYFDKAWRSKKALTISLDKDRRDAEVALLGDILDRIGVEWSLIPSYTDDRWVIRVKTNNTLSSKLIARLGSSKRKEMYIPDKMIYHSSKALTKTLVDTLKSITSRSESKNVYTYNTNNEKLAYSLSQMCNLYGYSANAKVIIKKGTDVGRGPLRKDMIKVEIWDATSTYAPTFIKKSEYSGKVYEIDLFDGQVYVKEGTAPVWTDPK